VTPTAQTFLFFNGYTTIENYVENKDIKGPARGLGQQVKTLKQENRSQ